MVRRSWEVLVWITHRYDISMRPDKEWARDAKLRTKPRTPMVKETTCIGTCSTARGIRELRNGTNAQDSTHY